MAKRMTEQVLIKFDPETRSKLDNLAEGSDMSKTIRGLILREWDVKNNSIRVPLIGTIGKTIEYTGHTVINEIETRQEGLE